jgi:hypothetical protein
VAGAAANLLTISRMKHSLSLALERASVRSKFLTKLLGATHAEETSARLHPLLHLSTQAFDLSMTYLAATGTNPDCPFASFSAFEGLAESSN